MSPNPCVLTWPFPAAAAGTLTFLQESVGSGTATTHTFAAQNLGAASTNRTIFCAIGTQSVVSSVTIGGVTATQDVSVLGGSSVNSFIYRATVPTGATGDIVVAHGNTNRIGIALWAYNGAAAVLATGSHFGKTVNVASGGFVIASCYSTSASFTWSSITERYDLVAPDLTFSGADIATGAGTLTVGLTAIDTGSLAIVSYSI